MMPSCFLADSLDRKPGRHDVESVATKLKENMYREEVQQLFGNPNQSHTSPVGPWEYWYYHDKEKPKYLELKIHEGRLASAGVTTDVSDDFTPDVKGALKKLQPGMSKADVERMLGKPASVSKSVFYDVETWEYYDSSLMSMDNIEMRFRNGVLEKAWLDD